MTIGNAGYAKIPPGATNPSLPPSQPDEFAPLAANAEALSPEMSAVDLRLAILAAVLAHRPVYLKPGEYEIPEPLLFTAITNGYIGCIGGRATITCTASWAGSDPEDVDNGFFKLYEVESATAATTVATTSPMGSQSIAVTSATGFTASKWFKITGISGAQAYYRQSEGAANETMELLRVDSSYVSGTTIPHGLPQRQWHGANGASKPVKLLDSVVDGFTFENIDFVAPTTEVVNCAVQARFARKVRLINCTAKGFTGHAFDFTGCRDCEVVDCNFLGWNNGRVSFTSCQKCRAVNCHDRIEPNSPRQNTNGTAQAKYAYRYRYQCYQVDLLDVSIEHAVGGFQCWGGLMCKVVGAARDLDFTALTDEEDFQDDEAGQSLFRGVVWDTGACSTLFAEFGFGNDFDLRGDASHTGTAYKHSSQADAPWNYHGQYFYHDIYDTTLKIRHYNVGTSALNSSRYAFVGILSQDVSGKHDVFLRGVHYAWVSRGSINTVYGDMQHEPQAGQGDASGELLCIHEGSLSLPTFDTVRWTGGLNAFTLVAGLIDTGVNVYLKPIIRRLVGIPSPGDTLEAENVYLGRFPDSASQPADYRAAVLTTGGSAVAGKNLVDAHGTTAPTGGTRMVVVLPTYFVYGGVQRVMPIVFLGHGCVAPLYCQATAVPLDAREFLEIDSSGRGIALTLAAVADWKKCVGRTKHRLTADGVAQLVR